jgi:hypothetical protein
MATMLDILEVIGLFFNDGFKEVVCLVNPGPLIAVPLLCPGTGELAPPYPLKIPLIGKVAFFFKPPFAFEGD